MKKHRSIIASLLVIVLGICVVVLLHWNDLTTQPCTIEHYQADTLPEEFYGYTVIDDSFLVTQLDKNRFLVCEQVELGAYVQHEVTARMRNEVLHIDISKGWATDDRNAQGSVFYAIISIPEGQTVSDLSLAYRGLVLS